MGKASLVFDAIFHDGLKERISKDLDFKTFIIGSCIHYILASYMVNLRIEIALERVEEKTGLALGRGEVYIYSQMLLRPPNLMMTLGRDHHPKLESEGAIERTICTCACILDSGCFILQKTADRRGRFFAAGTVFHRPRESAPTEKHVPQGAFGSSHLVT